MNNNKAFSLIELMVVIAIVAILAAVAVPAYRNYILQSKSVEVMSVLNTMVDKSVEYAQKHGVYGNANQIGMSSTLNSASVDNPQNIIPSAIFLSVDDHGPVTHCGAVGLAGASLDAYTYGIPEASAYGDGQLVFYYFFWNENGVIHRSGFYYAYVGSNTLQYDIVPNMPNNYIPSQAAEFAANVNPRLAAATCQ